MTARSSPPVRTTSTSAVSSTALAVWLHTPPCSVACCGRPNRRQTATLMKPVGGFSSWWVPLPASVSPGHTTSEILLGRRCRSSQRRPHLRLVGQGRAQHRGQREQQPVDVQWLNPLPTASTTSPPPITDLRLRRAGFLLFELQRLEHDQWTSVPQDTDQLINPLAMPLFLDRAETVLVEHVKEHADAIKGVRKPSSNPPLTGKEYPMNTWSKESSSSKPAV